MMARGVTSEIERTDGGNSIGSIITLPHPGWLHVAETQNIFQSSCDERSRPQLQSRSPFLAFYDHSREKQNSLNTVIRRYESRNTSDSINLLKVIIKTRECKCNSWSYTEYIIMIIRSDYYKTFLPWMKKSYTYSEIQVLQTLIIAKMSTGIVTV